MAASAQFRERMLAVWQRADEEAEAAKDGYFAIKLLTEFYGDLNEEERQFANEVIQDWLISPDAKMRFECGRFGSHVPNPRIDTDAERPGCDVER
jgi:hypothetical protein